MMLTVTRPLEQAIMEVPGVRRVRSRTFRGATEISAQFDPRTDMSSRCSMVQNRIAEIRGRLPPDLDLVVDRQTPAVFPYLIVNLTGGGSRPPTSTTTRFYVMRPALSRVPGVGHVEVLASDTREIEVIVDPAQLIAADLTVDDVADGAEGEQHAAAGGPLPGERPAASGARLGPVDDPRRHRGDAGRGQGQARRSACRDLGHRCSRARRIARSLITGDGGNARRHQRLAAGRRQHPRPCGRRRGRARRDLQASLPAGLQLIQDLRPRGVRRERDRQRPRRDPDRRRASPSSSCCSSCATGG